jgi:short-subunit dehydrogenase
MAELAGLAHGRRSAKIRDIRGRVERGERKMPDSRSTALVTGASSGIGEDLARLIAADGLDLVLVARGRDRLAALAAEIGARHGVRAVVVAEDLSDPAAPARVVERVRADGLVVDVLVNCAGFGRFGPFARIPWDVEREMMQLNVVSLVELTKLLLPEMIERGSGRILNVASTAAFQPGPLMAVYYATKAFVLSFSEAINRELRVTGVTVTALCPGPTSTGFVDAAEMHKSKLFKRNVPMQSKDVARIGYHAMKRGKSVVIPGLINKLLAVSIRFTPRDLVSSIVYKMQEPAAAARPDA